VSVPAREQRVLDEMQTMLQAGEARLASMFTLFTHLAATNGCPDRGGGDPAPVAAQPTREYGVCRSRPVP